MDMRELVVIKATATFTLRTDNNAHACEQPLILDLVRHYTSSPN